MRKVWRIAALPTGLNGYTLFLKTNMQVFDSRTLYDPGNLVMSLGTLPRLNSPEVAGVADGRVVIDWKHWSDMEVAHADERLCVVALFEGRMYSPVVLEGVEACRRDFSATVELGKSWSKRIHLYCFFRSCDGKSYSPSDYLCVTPKAVA